MTVENAENILEEIIYILNEFSLYRGSHRDEKSDFLTAVSEAGDYLTDYRNLLAKKIKGAELEL